MSRDIDDCLWNGINRDHPRRASKGYLFEACYGGGEEATRACIWQLLKGQQRRGESLQWNPGRFQVLSEGTLPGRLYTAKQLHAVMS